MKRNVIVAVVGFVAALELTLTVGMAAGPPASVTAWTGTPQATSANSDFPTGLQAVVRDAAGSGVQGAAVTFTAPSSGASGTFNGALAATVNTDAVGIARAPALRANGFGGTFNVTASVAGVSGGAQFVLTITGTGGGGATPTPAPPFNVRIISQTGTGAPTSVAAAGGSPQTTAVNAPFGAPLQARVTDASSNAVDGVSVTFSLPASGPSARFGGSATAIAVTNGSGIAVSPTLTATGNTGSYSATATAAGVSDSAVFSLTNTSSGGPPTGPAGNWTNVTPAGMTMDGSGTAAGTNNNYGLQGVHADPARPGTLYASVCYQGLWKSTDFGLTWTHVNVTSGSAPIDNGRSNFRIAPDGSYILANALYPIRGVSNGAWKSLDGGQTWTRYNVGATNGDDMYSFEIHPTDKSRVIGVPHSPPYNMFESRDGGQTWTDQGSVAGIPTPALTWINDDTVLAISDGDNGSGPGTWRGVRNRSTWPWAWTWTKVGSQQHWHGSSQSFVDYTTGMVIVGGGFGIQRSMDRGLTWTTVSNTNSGSIVATPTRVYSTASYATTGSFGPWFSYADRASNAASWIDVPVPSGMKNGAFYAATVFDGTKWVIVAGNWNAGIWRYVEP